MPALKRSLAAVAWLACAASSAVAADFPTKPVRLVVGFAPGGASDIVARLLEPEVGKRLGQPLVIDNKPGANGGIANEIVARAEPDGHTLLLDEERKAAKKLVAETRMSID